MDSDPVSQTTEEEPIISMRLAEWLDAKAEIKRLREDVAMWQRAYTEASVRYHQTLDKETLT